jgi:subtilisin
LRRFALVLSVAVISSVLFGLPARADRAGRYIVVLNDSVQRPGSVASDHADAHGAQISHVYRYALKGYAATIPDSRVDDVRSDPRVRLVEPDAAVHAFSHTVSTPTGTHRAFAADNSTLDIDGTDDRRVDVDVAVIDTGVDIDHPDLNVVGGKNCQTGTTYDDGNGHGSHVAGTIGGKDNGAGIAGMAPGARIWAVRVLSNSGSGSWSQVICGIDWVTQNASTIEVANMSLGGSGSDGSCSSTSMHQAICNSVNAGVTYAVAAGNSAANANNYVPATYAEVITVSALADFNGVPGGGAQYTCRSDVDDTFANFSNYGSDVDLIAPGVCIKSAWKGGGYNTISGTSMATPHVAGAAALYKATTSGATPAQVKTALQNAGNLNWNNADDKDSTKESLLDVSSTAVFAPAMVNGPATPPAPPVGSPPVANNDSATTPEDTAADVNVLANDTDPDVDSLGVSSVTTPAHGSASINADGTVRYTPSANYNGADSFNYTITDGNGNSASAGVSLTVNPVNDAPVANDDSAATSPGTGVNVAVLANDSDVDGDALSVWAYGQGTNGTVTAGADDSLVYTPNSGFTGTDTFTYYASDGPVLSNQATVTVTVAESASTVSVQTVTYSTSGGRKGTKDLLTKVVLKDNLGQPVAGASVNMTLTHGTQIWNGTGTTGADGTVTWKLTNAPSGCYETDVWSVVAGSLTRVGGTPANIFCK